MTHDEMIELIQHHRDGGEIESKRKMEPSEWIHATDPGWDFYERVYRIKQKIKIKPWHPEHNPPPFPLALRKKSWTKGGYVLFEVSANHAISCVTDMNGATQYRISWKELAAPNSEWETWDGKPCGTEVDE